MSSAKHTLFSILRVLIHSISAAVCPTPSRLRSPHIYMQVMNINWDSLHIQHPVEERKYIWYRIWIHFTGFSFCLVTWSWWHHNRDRLSTLLALCVGNPLGTGGYTTQKPALQKGFHGFIVVYHNKLLNKKLSCQWYEMPSNPGDIYVKMNSQSLWTISVYIMQHILCDKLEVQMHSKAIDYVKVPVSMLS